ncbi:hypothetical protein BRC83_05910 [Halobacteriales archaeon QS_1_68_17]|nr:MAG: hypothetical protein BRC83_05910 [Halobacteriales archaeon QS_1_68_17]
MTSLTDVYDGGVGAVAGRRRLYVGVGVFLAGLAMVVGGIVLATAGVGPRLGLGVYEARELAGLLAGIGLPAAFVGIFTVLPAGSRTRGAATIGASLAVLGVALFRHVYPRQWVGGPAADPGLTLVTTVVYAVGALTTFGCLFVAVATFRARNDPGGTARMVVTEEGTIRFVEPDDDGFPGMGSVGLFGSAADRPSEPPARPGATGHSGDADTVPASDGGSTTADGAGADELSAAAARGRPDTYCGNCDHFRYVRADGNLVPYCGYHEELMDDMDACEQWEPNTR